MPDPTDQSDPKEATEARLCAYLEGELPAAERAEIERHLAANPQHKTLLAELAKTREWVRSIPRVAAPVDLAESFQGQVERNMLLDQSPVRAAPRRWPQIWLVAAIVLLVLGLGALVTLMLFPAGKTQLAVNKPNPEPGTPVVNPLPAKSAPADPGQIDRSATENGPVPGAGADAAVLATPSVGPLPEKAVAPARENDNPKQTGTRDGFVAPAESVASPEADTAPWTPPLSGLPATPADHTLYVRVRTAKPQSAIDTATAFLDQRHLVIETPAPAAPGRPDLVTPNATQNQVANNAGPSTGGRPDPQHTQQQTDAATRPAVIPPTTAPAEAVAADAPAKAVLAGRGLTRDQADELAAALLIAASPGEVDLMIPDHGRYVDEATTTPITPGRSLLVSIQELNKPGFEKSNVVKVTDDGTVELPMIDPVRAAGMSARTLSKRISDQYRDEHVIPQATVDVALLPEERVAKIAGSGGGGGSALATTRATTGPAPEPADYTVVVITEPPAKKQ